MPFHCDDPRTLRWSLETLEELLPIAQDPDNPLVELVPTVLLQKQHQGPTVDDFASYPYQKMAGNSTQVDALPTWSHDSRLHFQHMTTEMLLWQNLVYGLRLPRDLDQHYPHAYFFQTPIVHTTAMLEHLLSVVADQADVQVETGHYYQSIEEMRQEAADLGCDAVVNCTGLGSRRLLGDNTLVGARGVTLLYDRATAHRLPSVLDTANGENRHDVCILTEDEPWGSVDYPSYLIPRGDVLVVGGSYLEGDEEAELRPEERERLLANARRLGIDTDKSEPIAEWTGFRPYRPTMRCEMDADYAGDSIRVFHNFGTGGSGWTVNVGAAKECASLVVQR